MAGAIDPNSVYRLKRGDRRAFEDLYDLLRAPLYSFLLRLSQTREVAEDLFQETWLKVARSAPSLRGDTDIKAWVFAIARNAFRSYRRWALLDVSRLAMLAYEVPFFEAPSDAEGAERLAELERVLAKLRPSLREAILLVVVEGFDHASAAAIVGIRPDNFRQRLGRARAELERLMARADGFKKERKVHVRPA